MSSKANEFDFSQLGPSAEQYALARAMLGEKATFTEVAAALRNTGLKREFVDVVIRETAGELIRSRVIAGVADQKIITDLVNRGLPESEAHAVLDAVRHTHHRRLCQRDGWAR